MIVGIRAGIRNGDVDQPNILVPLQVPLDPKDLKAMLDAREKWVTMGNQDLLVLRGLLDPLDLLDPRDPKVQKENGKYQMRPRCQGLYRCNKIRTT